MYMKTLDFSNGYSIRNFIPGLVAFSLILMLVGVDCIYGTGDTIWISVLAGFFALVFPVFSWCRNVYTISKDSLMVMEYNLIVKTMDIAIPLNIIERAEVVWSWGACKRVVRLYTPKLTVDLLCVAQREELVKTINAYLKSKKD